MQDLKSDMNILKVVKSRKRKNLLAKLLFSGFITGETVLCGALVFNKLSMPTFLALTSLLLRMGSSISNSKVKTDLLLKDLTKIISEQIDEASWCILNLNQVNIIPADIQVGEDLEAVNIIPILKRGAYIIIAQKYYRPVVLAQYEENNEQILKILDYEETLDELNNLDEKVRKKIEQQNKKLSLVNLND